MMTGNIPSKISFPTTTTHIIRLCLFQPTRRPKHLKSQIQTPWGQIYLDGKLGQQHADVFEAICYCREAKATLTDGRIKILVDPAKVRKTAKIKSGEQFLEITRDLEKAIIEIKTPEHLRCMGHLIDHITEAKWKDGEPITRKNPLTQGQRTLWQVELGKALCTLIAGDKWLKYNPSPIAELNYGIGQAIVRHVLSHENQPNGGWIINNLIKQVSMGEEVKEQTIRNRRRELRKIASQLESLGVKIEGERIFKIGR